MAFWETAGGAAAITGIAGLAGGSIGRGYSHGANKQSRKNMQRAYHLNRMTRQTAAQDKMADLRAAGLNPILAAEQGAQIGSGVNALPAFNPAQGASQMGTAMSQIAASAVGAAKTSKETQMIDKLMASAEVQEDLMDYFQGMTNKIDTITGNITDGIGRYYQLNYEGLQAIRGAMSALADEVSKIPGSLEEKIKQFKSGATEIFLNFKQEFGSGSGNQGNWETPEWDFSP